VNGKGEIHKYELGGDYFIVDPASGCVHIADESAFHAQLTVDNGQLTVNGCSDECEREFRELFEAGLLFSQDDCEQYAETSVEAPLKALCLHVSHDCNLKCKYCFADSVVQEKSIMSVETAKAAIDFMVENSGDRVDLEADFFGGEPLMAWDTVVATVEYARSIEHKNFRFTMTTNGLLLDDEKIAYINKEMSNCVLSLDGRKSVNDRIRPTKSGAGSFDLVIDRFKQLYHSRAGECYVRGTFTAYNLDFAEDVIELARLGFRNISIEPVTCYNDADYAIKPEHLPQIFENYERLYELIRDGQLDVNFFHFNVDLSGGPCVIRRLRGCGCGNDYMAVSPDGKFYPCHRFVGDERWNMGESPVLWDTPFCERGHGIKEYFTKTHIYSKSGCSGKSAEGGKTGSACWARFYCSGGCNASSYECFGDCRVTDSDSVECLMMKKRLECGIGLNALKSL